MEKPDTITVTASHREEVRANKVDVYLSVRGSSFFTGDAAMKKAKEVSVLVSELDSIGVKGEDIHLRGVEAENTSGILGRSTSVNYLLRVHCRELEKLADVLGVITAQKNVRLDQLVWRFPDDKALQARWLETCVAEAREKARQIAETLGVTLIGVHSFTEKWLDSGADQTRLPSASRGGMGIKARERGIDLGFSLITTRQLEVQIELDFRISSLA